MSLVQYPDSDSEPDDTPQLLPKPAPKRKRIGPGQTGASTLPPLPSSFHDLYSTNARPGTTDDPSLHGGRKRAVPHVNGNWPSHVYLEWVPSQAEFQTLTSLVDRVRSTVAHANSCKPKPLPLPEINPSLLSALGTPVPLHISLSRTLQIKTQDREHFVETLTSSVRKAGVRPFNVQFTGLKWVPNYERNRWFLVLGIKKPPQNELNKLLGACNEAAERCGHPPLYVGGKGDGPMDDIISANPAAKRRKRTHEDGQTTLAETHDDRSENFHVSIAWNLEEPHLEWINLVRCMNVGERIESLETPFEVVKARIGNAVNNIHLNPGKHGLDQGR